MTAASPVPDAGGIAVACPCSAPEAWRRLYEEEKRRADAAEARVERLEREKVQAHREAQYWKAQWGRARNALEAARAEAKDLRRVSGDALHLRSEVDRLETLLADIDIDTRKRSTMASLRIENGRLQAGSEALRKRLQEVESERDELCSQVETLSRAQFGRKSERGHKGTGRKTGPDDKGKTGKRGPRPGGETHGRTPRPELARKREVHDPPPEAVRPLSLVPVLDRTSHDALLWKQFIARYHYLGYKPMAGAQMRYTVVDRHGAPLAMIGMAAAAWKTAPRDRAIGWNPETRARNLHLVVNQSRLLLLPWIVIPNLGSHILSLLRRQLPGDWTQRYNVEPVLMETFVEKPRFAGTVYKAANWTHIGTTRGRGRYDRKNECALAKKDIWVQPLRRDWKRRLND